MLSEVFKILKMYLTIPVIMLLYIDLSIVFHIVCVVSKHISETS